MRRAVRFTAGLALLVAAFYAGAVAVIAYIMHEISKIEPGVS